MATLNRVMGLWIVLSLSNLASDPMANAHETGFSERFALADNRDAVLSELIPGTENYFYYHCLHCQSVGKVSEARAHLEAWIAKSGLNEQTQRMRTRQFLLEYRSNSQPTLDHLQADFGIQLDHPAPRKDEAASLPTRLDPKVLDWNAIARSYGDNLGAYENTGLPTLAPHLSNPDTTRAWLERVDRMDIPGLLDIIERELKEPNSRGFGWANIHQLLSAAQLLELQKRIPKLIESNAFVQARLRRIRPSDDQSLDDRSVLRDHLIALETFVLGLPESQNSLVASVLFHRLQFDEIDGKFDRERFLKYIKLPSNRPFHNPEYVARQVRRPVINLNANYQAETLLRPIAEDEALVRRYLEHFFQTDANTDSFSTFIDRDYLRRVFSSTKILYGTGDLKTYYAQLSPDEQRELQSRVELKFAPNNPTHYRPSDRVRLMLDLKNVPELLVKVYRLNARNILMRQKNPIGTDLDLDGLVANLEKTVVFAQSAELRHREVLEMPDLAGGGVWMVDILAAGQRSRTLIHKGELHAVPRMSVDGVAFRVFDADGKPALSAKALFGEREFATNDQGEIVVPFAREVKTESIVFTDGAIASVQMFVHHSEEYQLQAGFVLDPQSLLAGAKATVLIRPNLLCNGQLVSLAQLEKPLLTITSTDLDGVSATQTIPGLKLADSAECTYSFLVPQRLANIVVSLSGSVLKQSNETRIPVAATHSLALNGMARTAQVRDFYLTQTDTGFLLELRGRNGEPVPRLPIQLDFKLFGLTATTSVRLATNGQGIVDLGPLPYVERFMATADSVKPRPFLLPETKPTWPATYHALVGQTIEAVWDEIEGMPRGLEKLFPDGKPFPRLSLAEFRGGVMLSNQTDKIVQSGGLLTVKGLQTGTYRLADHWTGASMQISVVSGESQSEMLVSPTKFYETNRVRPVHIKTVKVSDDRLQVQLGNHDRLTRVHVIADAYEPVTSHGLRLAAPPFPLAVAARTRIPSFYINSLKLDQEYQYVLQRQLLKKYLGNMLPQPSAILNPWEMSVTQNTTQMAMGGDAMQSLAPKMAAPMPAGEAEFDENLGLSQSAAEYEFLKRGCYMLLNLGCDENGSLSIDRKVLTGLPSVTVMVVHPSGTTYRTIHLPCNEMRATTDRRLAQAFTASEKLTEIQSVRVIGKSDRLDLGEASSTQVKIYSAIPDVFQLYRTLLGNHPDFEKLACLARWPSLSEDEKETQYSDLACHELNLFLFVHDKAFFDRVVEPHLTNKMQKQFMDDFVLGLDLSKYTQPWQLARLNVVERVLLSKRIASQSSSMKRWLGDQVAAIPTDSAAQSIRFGRALMRSALWDVDKHIGNIDSVSMDVGSVRLTDAMGRSGPGGMGTGSGGMGMGGEGGGYGDPSASSSDKFFFGSERKPGNSQDRRSEVADAIDGRGGANRAFLKKEKGQASPGGPSAGKSIQLYQTIESTRRWAESNYFRLPIANQSVALVQPNAFWLDYLNHSGDGAFLSKHIDLPVNNVHEAILALAVLGLPLQVEPASLSIDQGRLFAKTNNDSIAFVQGIERIESGPEPAKLLATESLFLASDMGEEAKQVDPQSLVKDIVYRLRLVLTNPSESIVRVSVLQQIPQGAIALENAKSVVANKLDLAPFATRELAIKFYFPASGQFEHYGAQMAVAGLSAISAPSSQWKVLDAPGTVDESSWPYLAAWGSNDQVLRYLQTANLFKIDLSAIAWRMADRKFFDESLARLTEYGIYHPTLWAYSIKHNDAPKLTQFLEADGNIASRVGPVFSSELMSVEPVERLQFEHLDFRPLIVARMHPLGVKRVILNDGLASQYERMMDVLSHQKTIEPEQRLALVYYMLLQNRTEDAVAHFAKIEATALESKLQYDYFAAYLKMTQGNFPEAETIAKKYVQYPNKRWNDWFGQVREQIAERKTLQAGKVSDVAKSEDWKSDPANRLLIGAREQQNLEAASSLPVMDLNQDGEKVVLRHRNIETVEVKFYLMDVELLFSRSPFSQQDGSRLNMIEPNLIKKIELARSATAIEVALEIPQEMKNKNLVIETTGGGLTKNIVLYSNSLVLNLSPNMGRLQVLTKQGLQPLEGAYVKVYARDNSGAVKFYKDGYTDLRGHFDYTALSTNDLDSTQRFALLVLHSEHGTTVRESEPPKR